MPAIQLTQGTIEYRDEGAGPPVVLIHGALVNSQVWDGVVAGLTRGRTLLVANQSAAGSLLTRNRCTSGKSSHAWTHSLFSRVTSACACCATAGHASEQKSSGRSAEIICSEYP